MSEVELAAHVARYLESTGWTVAQEVELPDLGCRADIIATRGQRQHSIETKKSLTLGLIEQSIRIQPAVHLAAVAVPKPQRPQNAAGAVEILRRCGIGLWWATRSGGIVEALSPVPRPPVASVYARDAIRPEHQSGEWAEAGSQGGQYTEFAALRRAAVSVAATYPGISVDGFVNHLHDREPDRLPSEHKVARAKVWNWIRRGALGVESKGTMSNARIWVDGEAPRMSGK